MYFALYSTTVLIHLKREYWICPILLEHSIKEGEKRKTKGIQRQTQNFYVQTKPLWLLESENFTARIELLIKFGACGLNDLPKYLQQVNSRAKILQAFCNPRLFSDLLVTQENYLKLLKVYMPRLYSKQTNLEFCGRSTQVSVFFVSNVKPWLKTTVLDHDSPNEQNTNKEDSMNRFIRTI